MSDDQRDQMGDHPSTPGNPTTRSDPTLRIEVPAAEPEAPFWVPTADVAGPPATDSAAHPAANPATHPPTTAAKPVTSLDKPIHPTDPHAPDHGVPRAATAPGYAAYAERPPAPTGPHLPAILLGLVLLAVAVTGIFDQALGLNIDWAVTGPIGIVVVGGALVLLGAAGLFGNRRRG